VLTNARLQRAREQRSTAEATPRSALVTAILLRQLPPPCSHLRRGGELMIFFGAPFTLGFVLCYSSILNCSMTDGCWMRWIAEYGLCCGYVDYSKVTKGPPRVNFHIFAKKRVEAF
jgi:hypothetical protein